MKAVIFRRRGGPEVLSWEDVADPVPAPDEVLVRVGACGLNHLDLHVREGSNGMRAPLPHIGGLEPAGTIAAVGSAVTEWSVGDRVIVLAFTADGTCSFCLDGRENLCENREIIGLTRDGGFAEYLVAPASCLVRTPDALTDAEAAALPSAFGTAWHMLVTRAQTKADEWVLVLAAGSGIGSAAIQIARELGCTVIATAGSEEKLSKARELGAAHVINHAATPRFELEVMKITEGRGVDVVFEHIGPATWRHSLASLRTGGRVVTCGGLTGRMAETDLWNLFWRQFTIYGSMGATRSDMAGVLELVESGRVEPVIDRTFPLAETRAAQEHLDARRAFGKVVVVAEPA
ncbi:MAG TPA: zinc-binding dehydrogenase [Candidatus Limnocylindria bacterium]|jgi:NADPH:quinone reductase-like Zn-dependent oxidoreductase|nr:zinc-binding dehydrogenase [Candidatus Limnocylindria bacterium]